MGACVELFNAKKLNSYRSGSTVLCACVELFNAKKLNSYRSGYQLNSPVLFKSVKTSLFS